MTLVEIEKFGVILSVTVYRTPIWCFPMLLPQKRFCQIGNNLLLLDDRDLAGILASAEALAKDKKGT